MGGRLRVLLAVGLLFVARGYASADAVTDWNRFFVTNAAAPPVSRPANEIGIAAGYMHIAIYDAIVALEGGYTPFATRIDPVPSPASRDAAVAAAANRILTALYPAGALNPLIATHYGSVIAAIADPVARDNGIAVGLAAADGLLALRNFPNDGWQATVPYQYVTPPVAGSYQRTPPSFQPTGPVTPWAARLRPFTMRSPSQFRADGPPALASQQWADDFNEVKTLGALVNSSRTDEQTTISLRISAGPI